jgi:hypothetical protein
MSLEKPKVVGSLAEKELDKAATQFEKFDENIKSLTLDRMNAEAKPAEREKFAPIAQVDLAKSKDIYIKPRRSIGSIEKFNEKFRNDYNFQSEYVHFKAYNNEIVGEAIEFWTKPFPGMPAQEWVIPVNKPVWAPRFVAEKIKRSSYHRLVMDESKKVSDDGMTAQYGQMAVDTTIQRLDALPVSTQRSIFMGANSFAA